MLSEISQSPEDKYCMVSLPEGPRGEKFRETTRMVVAREGHCFMDAISVLQDEAFWRLHQQYECA